MSNKEVIHSEIFDTDLLSILFHDLKTPVNAIQSFVMLIDGMLSDRDNFDNDTLRHYLNIIKKQSNLLDSQLKKLSQWKFATVKVDLFNIEALFEEVIKSLDVFRLDKDIEIITRIHFKTRQIKGYSQIFLIVLHNLLENAIKFSYPHGKVYLEAYDIGDKIEIVVRDTGVGINLSEINQIFSMNGYRQEGTTGEKGLGIGLFLCKRILNKLDEQLWVKRESNGTSFHFTITE